MIRLFAGYDPREAVGFHTFVHSVLARASVPVQITPLASMGLPQGSNTFTLSRFLVPWLCGFRGHAVFADASDMLCLVDVAQFEMEFDNRHAVRVVKHLDYESLHARKYVGTEMECRQTNYSRKNWMSVAVYNCAHSAWFAMTPKAIAMMAPLELLQLQTLNDCEIGSLAPEWNVLVDEGQQCENAKLLHWSNGLPTFKNYRNARRSADWFREFEAMTSAMQPG